MAKLNSSQRTLLLAATGIAVFVIIMVTIGFSRRDEIRGMGGPMRVWAINETERKLRVDLVVGSDFGTLELEPGWQGMIRFDPGEEGAAARALLFHRNENIFEVRSPVITREDPDPVVFRILGPREVDVLREAPE